jgi:hypothetical protein
MCWTCPYPDNFEPIAVTPGQPVRKIRDTHAKPLRERTAGRGKVALSNSSVTLEILDVSFVSQHYIITLSGPYGRVLLSLGTVMYTRVEWWELVCVFYPLAIPFT